MNLLSFFFPQLLAKKESSVNGTIEVTEFFGIPTVHVSGSIQSGQEITAMWQHAIPQVPNKNAIQTILVLGLGGGNIITVLKKQLPSATVTAIELDSMMINIAKEHFHLSPDTLTLINADAMTWVKTTRQHFDLVIIDLWIGPENPSETRTSAFLKDIKRIAQGPIIYNVQYHKDSPREYEEFTTLCHHMFPRVKEVFHYPLNHVLLLL